MSNDVSQFKQQFVNAVRQIVHDELDNLNILRGHLRLGTVESVLPNSQLRVFVDGSTTSQVIDCNPDVTFAVGNFVWVSLINGDSKNKFVFARRK